MKILNKLPNSRREPPGLEWTILKKLPKVLFAGTLIPLAISLSCRLFEPQGTAAEIAKQIKSVDIMCIAMLVTLWMAALTVAIGCCVVLIMKGPAYVADSYELPDSERPRQR
ncbi:MAG: hypothetical protein WBN81_06630 [Gammaproteobacteria bacterium]